MRKDTLVIKDCWDELLYSGDFLRCFESIAIVDNNLIMDLTRGLHVSSKLKPLFKKTGIYGDVGNCRLLFLNIHYLKIKIGPFLKIGENLKTLSLIEYEHKGKSEKPGDKFGFEGYFNPDAILQAFVDFECDAERFELHILDPA